MDFVLYVKTEILATLKTILCLIFVFTYKFKMSWKDILA